MKTNQHIEKAIVQVLQERSDEVIAPPSLKQHIDMELDKRIMEEHHIMKRWDIKKIVVFAAICCFVLSMGVFAAGQVTGYVTSLKPDKNYNSYTELSKAKESAGFNFKSIENFSNGYQFISMSVSTTDKTDDDFNRVGSFQEWSADYCNEAGEQISLYSHEIQEESSDEGHSPNETFTINGIQINYYVDHYKFVPVDYELTDEDMANEEKGNYYISYGSDEIEECDYVSVDWQEDGICYYFLGNETKLSADELFEMAGEVINQ